MILSFLIHMLHHCSDASILRSVGTRRGKEHLCFRRLQQLLLSTWMLPVFSQTTCSSNVSYYDFITTVIWLLFLLGKRIDSNSLFWRVWIICFLLLLLCTEVVLVIFIFVADPIWLNDLHMLMQLTCLFFIKEKKMVKMQL